MLIREISGRQPVCEYLTMLIIVLSVQFVHSLLHVAGDVAGNTISNRTSSGPYELIALLQDIANSVQ